MTKRKPKADARVARLEAALARLRTIGGQMANVCFNWSQESSRVGELLSASDRLLLKRLQAEWDDAVRGGEVRQLLADATGRERLELRAEMTALRKRRHR